MCRHLPDGEYRLYGLHAADGGRLGDYAGRRVLHLPLRCGGRGHAFPHPLPAEIPIHQPAVGTILRIGNDHLYPPHAGIGQLHRRSSHAAFDVLVVLLLLLLQADGYLRGLQQYPVVDDAQARLRDLLPSALYRCVGRHERKLMDVAATHLLLWIVAGYPMVYRWRAPARAAVHVHLHTAVPLHEAAAFHLHRLARTGLVVSFPLGADMAVQLWGALQLVGQ